METWKWKVEKKEKYQDENKTGSAKQSEVLNICLA